MSRRRTTWVNPISRVWPMWLFAFPIALILYIVFKLHHDGREDRKKRKQRGREYRGGYPEFDYWMDDQGLW